jgi:hypothetical protein
MFNEILKKVLLIFIATLFLVAIVETGKACSCSVGSTCSNYNNAKSIFIGKVVSSKEQKLNKVNTPNLMMKLS